MKFKVSEHLSRLGQLAGRQKSHVRLQISGLCYDRLPLPTKVLSTSSYLNSSPGPRSKFFRIKYLVSTVLGWFCVELYKLSPLRQRSVLLKFLGSTTVDLLRHLPTKLACSRHMHRLSQIKNPLTHKSHPMKYKVAVIGSGNWYSLGWRSIDR
jgi:hypothetical protein